MSFLTIRNLEVRYGDLIGVAGVSLDVGEGEVVALLGSNGAGKTTTLNAVAGLIPASAGQITLAGERIPLGRAPFLSFSSSLFARRSRRPSIQNHEKKPRIAADAGGRCDCQSAGFQISA